MDPKYLKTPPNTNSDRAPLTDFKIEIPKQFDAREKWPYCKSLWEIRDQSKCGSCWAIASAEVITDRMCIATSGSVQVPMSAIDIVSCCDFCGYKFVSLSLRLLRYGGVLK
ncbi:hypothetical protein AB6A40_009027 [Gnathostoma spinigerum]|uniref:Peptidase C1A papain C-terminal domain-containing protein n=1 Tax=Gnathostoma spinigerum TaxID=75299 RepID=A0ABD6EZ06_9BILA